jgi:hypothetical protein
MIIGPVPDSDVRKNRNEPPKQARAAKYKYARQIKKAADGRRCCVGSQAWKAFEIQPERRFKADGKINVGAAAQRIRPDETKKTTIEKEVMS